MVNRFSLETKNHLRTTNANALSTISDGVFPSYLGGNDDLFVSIISVFIIEDFE